MKFQRMILSVAMVITLCFGSSVYGQGIGYDDLSMTNNSHSIASDNEVVSIESMMELIKALQEQVDSLQTQLITLTETSGSCASQDSEVRDKLVARIKTAALIKLKNKPIDVKWKEAVLGRPLSNLTNTVFYLHASIGMEYGELVKERTFKGIYLETNKVWKNRVKVVNVKITISKNEYETLTETK